MSTTELLTHEKYKKYLEEINLLIDSDPLADSEEGERLMLLTLAVQEYEKKRFVFEKPTAVEAIKFRMEEMGLKQNDLVPYIGTKGRVSEILSGKRSLSMNMIKLLHKHLDIPTDVLLNDGKPNNDLEEVAIKEQAQELTLSKLPCKDIIKRGWVPAPKNMKQPESVMAPFLAQMSEVSKQRFLFRKSATETTYDYSLVAWATQVLILAKKQKIQKFEKEKITEDVLKQLGKLSFLDKGPLMVKGFLNKYGIKFVLLKHLPGTKIDGACFLDEDNNPVIALTLRYDRLDYFWFTLMHEMAHVWKHLNEKTNGIFDEISESEEDGDALEKEANKIARDTFISRTVLKSSNALIYQTDEAVKELASSLGIHYAIVAGRLRKELRDWTKFPDLIGQGQVRFLFKEELS